MADSHSLKSLWLTATNSGKRLSPALQRGQARPRLHADAGVHGDAAFAQREYGVQVELGHFGEVVRKAREAQDEVDERRRVGGRRAAEAADQAS